MPAFLQPKLNTKLKSLSLLAFFLLFPLFFFAQSLTGLWVGTLSNDSSTVRKDQSFEIVLTEYRGKVYGYSRSEFIVNDTLYYIVKRVKGIIEGDRCEVSDDEIISYNFRGKLDKGIKVTSTFLRNQTDSTWYLAGTWKTNATKKYYAVTGKVDLSVEKDLNASKIFPHLEELNLADKVAFYKERKESIPVVKVVSPENTIAAVAKSPAADQLKNNTESLAVKPQTSKQRTDVDPAIAATITDTKKTGPPLPIAETREETARTEDEKPDAVKKPVTDLPKSTTKPVTANTVAVNTRPAEKIQANNTMTEQQVSELKKNDPVTARNEIKPESRGKTVLKNDTLSNIAGQKPSFTKQPPAKNNTEAKNTVSNPGPQKTTAVSGSEDIASTVPVKSNTTPVPGTDKNDVANKTVAIAVKPEAMKADITENAAVVEGRKSEFTQEVNFKGDSLVISLYDNGVIDGDTVSVFMNGEVILAKQGLKASAIKKTIYLKPGKDDEFTLVLFAENLGQYPPNTGLLVVRDGNDVYNLRFSADYQKNAGVVFRRKK